MRRAAACLTVLAALGFTSVGFPLASARTQPEPSTPVASEPPHAWLFGTWTGGLFPVLDGMTAQDCRTQPTVGFAKDTVSHATLTGSTMAVHNVETVRATAAGAEFRFLHEADPGGSFNCENPDELHVVRSGPNEISFPRCSAFPYPLQRCP